MIGRQQQVFLLHGVGVLGGMGAWQAPVADLLGPRFKVIPIKYAEYRWLGFISLVFDLRLLLISSGFAALFHSSFTQHPWAWIFMILLCAFLGAQLRYRRTLNTLMTLELLGSGLENYRAPDVIAHSLGTHFVGTALRKHLEITFRRIILAGSVLPANYPWKQILTDNPKAVQSVRNYVGCRDLVPRIARAVNSIGLLRGFGTAGSSGFVEEEGFVHTINTPKDECAKCLRMAQQAPIHNILCEDFGHHGVFKGQARIYDYVENKWMPFFWGLTQPEYQFYKAAGRHLSGPR